MPEIDINKKDNINKKHNISKVLVIAYYFPPMGLSGVQRTLKFVKYLPEYNWQPIVLTTGITKYYAFDDTLLDELGETIIYRTEKDPFNIRNKKNNTTINFPSPLKQKIRRLLLQSIFIPDSRKRWKKYAVALGETIIEEHPDIKLIYATGPPFTDFLIANELSEKYNIPFVIDYRDLWADNSQYFFPTPFHKRKHISLEANIHTNASKSFVITRQMKEKIISRYRFIRHQDICIIPHGFDKADFNHIDIQHNPNKLVIAHSGIFPDDRTPKYFLKAILKFLNANPNAKNKIELRFIGLLQMKYINLIKKYNLDKIVNITGYLPHLEAVKQIMSADILWLMLNNNIETPGKFFEYIGTKKPILIMLPDSAIKQIAEEYKASFITPPKDINKIAVKIEEIYSLWKQNKLPAPDDDFVKQFDRKYLTFMLAKEMASL